MRDRQADRSDQTDGQPDTDRYRNGQIQLDK